MHDIGESQHSVIIFKDGSCLVNVRHLSQNKATYQVLETIWMRILHTNLFRFSFIYFFPVVLDGSEDTDVLPSTNETEQITSLKPDVLFLNTSA